MSEYRIELRPAAVRALRKLDPPVRRRLQGAIALLGQDPRPPAARALQGPPRPSGPGRGLPHHLHRRRRRASGGRGHARAPRRGLRPLRRARRGGIPRPLALTEWSPDPERDTGGDSRSGMLGATEALAKEIPLVVRDQDDGPCRDRTCDLRIKSTRARSRSVSCASRVSSPRREFSALLGPSRLGSSLPVLLPPCCHPSGRLTASPPMTQQTHAPSAPRARPSVVAPGEAVASPRVAGHRRHRGLGATVIQHEV